MLSFLVWILGNLSWHSIRETLEGMGVTGKFFDNMSHQARVSSVLRDKQEYALWCFNRAWECMMKREFDRAKDFITRYREYVDYSLFENKDKRLSDTVDLSIVVVSHNANEKLLRCLTSIMHVVDSGCEVIVVDNGGNDAVIDAILNFDVLYVRCPVNLYPSEARNVAVSHAIGKVVAFVDDDAIVDDSFVRAIRAAFAEGNIVGLRGRVIARTRSPFNEGIRHYDLGDRTIYGMINTEGNAAILRDIYTELNGMNPLLFGHEGIELSYRIYARYGYQKMIYCPHVIVYHDYAESQTEFDSKQRRTELMHEYLVRIPGMRQYLKRMKRLIEMQMKHRS